MPFGSYLTPDSAASAAVRLLKEGQADLVKLEGGARVTPQVKAITDAGISVVGHVGCAYAYEHLLWDFFPQFYAPYVFVAALCSNPTAYPH